MIKKQAKKVSREARVLKEAKGHDERILDGLSLPNQNEMCINKYNMVVFYKMFRKYNEIQLQNAK